MELADKIALVNDLIKENEEATIREYLDALKEIESIEYREVLRNAIQSIQKHRA